MLWGGEKWIDMGRFQHTDVDRIEFSPCERYLVTLSEFFKDTEEVCFISLFVKVTHLAGRGAGGAEKRKKKKQKMKSVISV